MQDLRLIGVHEDGQHLLLADADGGRFRLALDEPLRAAARRDRPRLGQLQIEMEGGMRPREVQALIRRGLSAEEVAERSGWPVEKVHRFEGPILAEREHVAGLARRCAVGVRGPSPVSLEDRVSERLRDRGVERDDVEWDSSRDEDGVWQLTMTFAAGGRRRTATWHYEPLGGSVLPTNDEARWLSEDATSGLIPAPHRAPTPGDLDVYDVDADGGIERATSTPRAAHEPIDLMAAMREHSARGRRSRRRSSPTHTPGDDESRPDALPIEELALDLASAPPPPAARARKPVGEHLERPTRSSAVVGGWPEDDEPQRPETDAAERPGEDEPDRSRPAGASSSRKGRPSVPSWDDIVFGTKGSGPA
ncbi:septation protein SepH [Phycicoccus sp.]|uniref:septation protein SepH n=1 Tax=Phycicoccus sp. TaxID=1902410 RepID=UPI002CAC0597|nr:septation protein SepH [Phycicoccus sp.]HMM95135.1 septation protein SepH [Phycicoccus sp.]